MDGRLGDGREAMQEGEMINSAFHIDNSDQYAEFQATVMDPNVDDLEAAGNG